MYFMLLVYMPILYQIFEIYQIIPQSTVVEGVIDKNIPSVRHYSPNSQQFHNHKTIFKLIFNKLLKLKKVGLTPF